MCSALEMYDGASHRRSRLLLLTGFLRLLCVCSGDSEDFSMHDGYIPGGGDIASEFITVTEAKERCLAAPTCQGFTFMGGPQEGPMWITLKNEWDVAGTGWTSYRRGPTEAAPAAAGGAAAASASSEPERTEARGSAEPGEGPETSSVQQPASEAEAVAGTSGGSGVAADLKDGDQIAGDTDESALDRLFAEYGQPDALDAQEQAPGTGEESIAPATLAESAAEQTESQQDPVVENSDSRDKPEQESAPSEGSPARASGEEASTETEPRPESSAPSSEKQEVESLSDTAAAPSADSSPPPADLEPAELASAADAVPVPDAAAGAEAAQAAPADVTLADSESSEAASAHSEPVVPATPTDAAPVSEGAQADLAANVREPIADAASSSVAGGSEQAAPVRTVSGAGADGLLRATPRIPPEPAEPPNAYRDNLFVGELMAMTHRSIVAPSMHFVVMCYAHLERGGACCVAPAAKARDSLVPATSADAASDDKRLLPPLAWGPSEVFYSNRTGPLEAVRVSANRFVVCFTRVLDSSLLCSMGFLHTDADSAPPRCSFGEPLLLGPGRLVSISSAKAGKKVIVCYAAEDSIVSCRRAEVVQTSQGVSAPAELRWTEDGPQAVRTV